MVLCRIDDHGSVTGDHRLYTGSVALLADTIHNFGDAFTAVPLWIAFRLAQLRPSKRFPYGYGKVEDLAGVLERTRP